ncbi:MAG: GWxTD domain-containing protein [Bacteroidales bacterium]|nr:GWxTD domain-containing protein [Bacteroidales bacterium]
MSDIITVDKSTLLTAQNFRFNIVPQNFPLFYPFVANSYNLKIEYAHQADSFFIMFYSHKNFPTPKPSGSLYSMENLYVKPDSTWKIPNNPKQYYRFDQMGIYKVTVDTSKPGGANLLRYYDNYPKIDALEALLQPLDYVASPNEMEKIVGETNLKLAIDNFWLSKTESMDRARELIRVYYNRVYLANYYFTDIAEGWKTDRGMVYVLFGPPNKVTRDLVSETWAYTKKESDNEAVFTFIRETGPLDTEVFVLNKNESDNYSFKRAVDNWRRGDVFYYGNL